MIQDESNGYNVRKIGINEFTCGNHKNGRQGIGQDVPEHDAERAEAQHPSRLDVRPRRLLDDRGADQPDVGGGEQHDEHRDGHPIAAAEHAGDDDGHRAGLKRGAAHLPAATRAAGGGHRGVRAPELCVDSRRILW